MNVQRNCCYVHCILMPIKLTTFCSRSTAFAYLKLEYIFLIIASVLQLWSHRPARAKAPQVSALLGVFSVAYLRIFQYVPGRSMQLTHSVCIVEPNKADCLLNFNYNSEVPNQRTFKSKNFCLWSYILLLTLILRRTHHQEDITCVHSFAVTAQGHFELLFWLTPTTNLQFFGHKGPTTNGKSKEIKIKWPPGAHVCAVYLFTGKNGLADPPCF